MTEFEDIYDALKATVGALGGSKVVAAKMRPTVDLLKARSWLLNCLDPNHSMKFDPEEVQWIWRAGCDAGYYDGARWAHRDTHFLPADPASVEGQLAAVLKQLQVRRRNDDDAMSALTAIKDNPKLRAVMAAANIDVEALLQ